MITAIVRRVESMLLESGRRDVQVEIVFPVSPDAVSTNAQSISNGAPLVLPNGLTIVPGAASGEVPYPRRCGYSCDAVRRHVLTSGPDVS